MSKSDTRERALGCFASCILLPTPYDLLVSFGPKYPGGAPMGRGAEPLFGRLRRDLRRFTRIGKLFECLEGDDSLVCSRESSCTEASRAPGENNNDL